MLEFVIISGLATMGVNQVCSLLVTKKAKDNGYVNKLYFHDSKGGIGRKTFNFLFQFIPGLNIILSALVVAATAINLVSPSKKKDKLAFGSHLETDACSTKSDYDYYDKQLKDVDSAMKLDGATPEVIKSEMKKAEEEIYSDHVKLSDKQYRELEAMSDTALWLRDLEVENGLSYEERSELFPFYTRDFMNTKENAKPEAIQKTLKMIDKRLSK